MTDLCNKKVTLLSPILVPPSPQLFPYEYFQAIVHNLSLSWNLPSFSLLISRHGSTHTIASMSILFNWGLPSSFILRPSAFHLSNAILASDYNDSCCSFFFYAASNALSLSSSTICLAAQTTVWLWSALLISQFVFCASEIFLGDDAKLVAPILQDLLQYYSTDLMGSSVTSVV